jgi:hypothetical protein
LATNLDFSKRHTRFCIAPWAEALCMFMLSLRTFLQLVNFLVASCCPGQRLSYKTPIAVCIPESYDQAKGPGAWNISKPKDSPTRTCWENIRRNPETVPGRRDQKASRLARQM